jgi:hypothetical protein
MDTKRKTCDIPTWKKHFFLGISPTNIDTLVSSLCQCVETRGIEVFWLLSEPLPHPIGHHLVLSNALERISQPSCELLYATNTSHHKQETFINILCIESLCPQKHTTERCPSVVYSSSTVAILTLNVRMRVCYLDSHEAWLCWYLVIHIEKLLHPLQVIYFCLCPIYWPPS